MAAYKDGQNTANARFKKFVPKVWTGRLLANMKGSTVLAEKCTREFEGDISNFGDTVTVNAVGRVDLVTYNANSTELTYGSNDGGEIVITVDVAKAWTTAVEDIEKAQSKPAFVNDLMKEASRTLAKNTEQYLYAGMCAAAVNDTPDDMGQRGGSSTTNGGAIALLTDAMLGTCETGSGTGVLDTQAVAKLLYSKFLKLGERLVDMGAPEEGRFIVVPSFFESIVLDNDRFVGANAVGSGEKLGKGWVGKWNGFDIHVMPRGYFRAAVGGEQEIDSVSYDQFSSGWVSVGGVTDNVYTCIAGVEKAHAYVDQLSKTETLRLEGKFANGIRGLHMYGQGQLRPQYLITGTIDDPDEWTT